MRDRVLAIVTLIAQMVLEDQDQLSEGDLVGELMAVGFAADEIDAAFNWMENLTMASREQGVPVLSFPTTRIYTAEEARSLSADARGFLIRLRSMGILDDQVHEDVMERALEMADGQLSLKELKTIIALTLFARSHDDWRRELECLFEDDWSRLYH